MLEFGIRDHESTPWGGSVAMQGGEILELRGHHFTAEHRIDGHTWTAGSTSWPASHQVMHPREVPLSARHACHGSWHHRLLPGS